MKKRKTNKQLINHFINHGSPLNQVFIVYAITELADRVVENEKKIMKQDKNSFINPELWILAAKQWIKDKEENK